MEPTRISLARSVPALDIVPVDAIRRAASLALQDRHYGPLRDPDRKRPLLGWPRVSTDVDPCESAKHRVRPLSSQPRTLLKENGM